MLSDWNAVDDVLQEAGVTMWEKIGQLENAERFLPWARVIVRLKCHSAIQRVPTQSPGFVRRSRSTDRRRNRYRRP
jgi:DNA-directed RNA polymerase specialized sigma24 family protein